MTVKAFAAFTGMSAARVREEIRAGRLAATMDEKTDKSGKKYPDHYEITEDPATWLTKRNPENLESKETKKPESPPSLPRSQQEPAEKETSPWVIVGIALAVAVAGAVAIILSESNRTY